MILRPGTFLQDRYEILEQIGSGGMSVVYKAKCHKLNRLVAIKVLKEEFCNDSSFVSKFKMEAQSAAGLSHPNIVSVYDVIDEGKLHYIVMELIEGITLKSYIQKKGRLEIKETIGIAIQVAQGIAAAHEQHIIHRDIKPQNMIISRDGKVKVADFGIARAVSAQTMTSSAMGSVHYISPEQARGGYSDEKSDIYSLGITMYEMVTGKVPYDGENNVSVALQHIQGNMVPPRQLNPDIPRSVERIILKCTQKKPDLRYSSAKELIMDLRRALAEPDGNYVVIGAVTPSGGVGDSTTVVMDENDVQKLRNASLHKDREPARRAERLTPEERRRRQLEEERKEYEEYDNHHERKKPKPKKPEPVIEEDEDEDDVNPALDKTMTIFGIVGAIIIVIVIFFLIGRAGGLFGGFGNTTKSTRTSGNISTESRQVSVPDCAGKTQDEAITLLQEKELDYKIQEKEDDSIEKGVVISSTPAAGAKVDKGTIITLFVSKGNESADMPDVVNMSLEAAKSQLEGMGLKVKVENVEDDSVEENHVIKTSPVSGEKVKLGTTVTLTVSKGRSKTTVPYLVNKSYDDATAALSNANLQVGSVSYENSDSVEVGYVIRQGLDANSQVDKGTYVDLVISTGPKETEPAEGSASVYMPGDNPFGHDIGDQAAFDSGTVTVQVEYADGRVETVYAAYCSSPDAYDSGWGTTVSGELGTSATVRAYVEGVQFASYSIYFS